MVAPKIVKATQLVMLPHPEGVSFAILDAKGVVYIKTEAGWEPMDMREASNVK